MKEEEIRPQKLFDELLRLSIEDIDIYFKDSNYKKIKCPSCGKDGEFIFNKNGFNFEECKSCKSFYVSPRPDKESFDEYYTTSESTKYWANTFYHATKDARIEKIWKPKVLQIIDKIDKIYQDVECIVEIGGGYGLFMEEFLKKKNLNHYVIEPSPDLAQECRKKNLNVIRKFLEDIVPLDIDSNKKLFVSFELFEHLFDPKLFLDTLFNVMDSGEIFIFTTLNGMGVDLQSLMEDSKSVSPPFHVNFFNPKSINSLLKRSGFELIEVSTPGKLDIDILKNNKENIKDRFIKNFLEYANEDEQHKMQEFISQNNLSSHMMIICKKV